MTVVLKKETERLVQEEIQRGQYQSVDELIVQGVYALREKFSVTSADSSPALHKTLYELLTQPPFAGSELHIERQKDYPRPVDL